MRNVALFDLDGTLLPWDTQVLFLNFVLRRHRWRLLLMFFYVWALPLFLIRIVSELVMKRLFLGYLTGFNRSELDTYATEFAETVIAPLLYEKMRGYVNTHKAYGDEVLLVTASPSIYAHAIGDLLGVDGVLSTEVEYGKKVPYFPVLTYGNNKGNVKVKRLSERGIVHGNRKITAYSDSMADAPMLRMADETILVNPSETLVTEFKEKSPIIEIFTLPWRTKMMKLQKLVQFFLGMEVA